MLGYVLVKLDDLVDQKGEDIDKLKEFYARNGFIEFDKRQLDADEETDFKGKYLIQMLKYLK